MTRFAIVALITAALAGNAFAGSTTILNDKNRPVITPTPAAPAVPAVAQPAAPKASEPKALTGDQTSAPARNYNDKNRSID